MIHFPNLNRIDTMELPLVAAFSGVLGGIVFPFTKIGAILLGLPAFVIAWYWIITDIRNQIRRFVWSGAFDGRLSRRTALKLIRNGPSQYALYVQYYSGGFDRTHLTPAAVLENVETMQRYAIFPPSWKVIDECKELGIQIRDPQGNSISR